MTSFCSSYCRFCIRKRNWLQSDAASAKTEVDQAVAYLRAHEEVREVLISGSDPLTLPVEQLDYILSQVRTVPHIDFVRIGSCEPVMLPMRCTDELLQVLDKYGPLWVNTHFNHPREITEEAAIACEKLARLGIPLGNQTVLLAGVNDDVATMKALVHGLLRIRVRPYYLYYGRGCARVCCQNGRPPVYPDEVERIDANLDKFLPQLRPEARTLIEKQGYLSARRKFGSPTMRVVKGWCVFFKQGCVLQKVGSTEGDKFRYKPAVRALFPLERDVHDRWYVRQRGFKGEKWDLFCREPSASVVPDAESLREEIALARRFTDETE